MTDLDKWNETLNAFAGKSLENQNEKQDSKTNRYIKAAYVKRTYGKWMIQDCKAGFQRRQAPQTLLRPYPAENSG